MENFIVMCVTMNLDKTKFVKPKDVARLLKLDLLTIYIYIHEGKLKAAKFGRNYRIEDKDLESFIKKNMVKVPKEIKTVTA